jgi:hypothetical protein
MGQAIKNPVPETLFTYGGEMVARPSVTAHYLVPDLEMGLQGIELAYDFDRTGTRRRDVRLQFDADRGEVLVRMIVPMEAADRTLYELQQAWHNVWDLRELFGVVLKAVSEVARAASKAASQGVETMPKAVGASAALISEGMAVALREATRLSTPHSTVMPAIEPVPPPASFDRLPADASVARVATRLAELTGLSDRELGQLFPGQVSREHFHRWRSGKSDNPTAANRRRLWFLLTLIERLAQGGVSVDDWIRNPTAIDDLTPLDLLRLGRFDEVERLAAWVISRPERKEIMSVEGRPVLPEHGPASFAPRSDEPTADLVFEKEHWIETEDDLEDETDDA